MAKAILKSMPFNPIHRQAVNRTILRYKNIDLAEASCNAQTDKWDDETTEAEAKKAEDQAEKNI